MHTLVRCVLVLLSMKDAKWWNYSHIGGQPSVYLDSWLELRTSSLSLDMNPRHLTNFSSYSD